jgi:polysaccharide export outer membrane protein
MNVMRRIIAGRACSTGFLSALLATTCLASQPVRTGAAVAAPVSSLPAPIGVYVISPGDELIISVLNHDEFKSDVTILPDGTFNYPVVGKVHAAGLTVDQLTSKIVAGLSRVLDQPPVTIAVVQSRKSKVSVIGSAKAPGSFELKPQWRVLDAIAACGGPAQEPGLTQATLVTDGGRRNTTIDLGALMSGRDMSQNLALSDGDILMLGIRDPSVSLVQVTGDVQKPGQFAVPPDGLPVITLLGEAGGAMPNAALSRAQILHAGQVRTVNLHGTLDTLDSSLSKERLVAGDVLLVPTNKARIAVMGEVKNPSVYNIPDGENLPLPMALSLAGGPTDDGDKSKLSIIRRGEDGKPLITTVDLRKYLAEGGLETSLQPGDVVYVPTRHKGSGLSLGQLGGVAALWKLLL